MIRLLAAAALLAATSCAAAEPGAGPIDPRATRETRALFLNLRALAPERTLFGHQNDLAYGYGWTDEPGRSDVKAVTGAYPAVYGWDLMDLFGRDGRYDPAKAAKLKAWILEGYGRGGVITMSWHQGNPASGGDAWDVKSRAVERIIPGGDLNAAYLARLDIVAGFLAGLKDDGGKAVPVIFRPFHEHSGSWFWWGRDLCTPSQYKAMWRMVVHYLRDRRGLHNLLYAYSTDVFDSRAEYLERYPGDDVVDVLGFDDYHSIAGDEGLPVFERRLHMLVEMARARGKIPALTETGLEALPDPSWWTRILLKGIEADPVGKGIAWVLVWRNANPANDRKEHFYAPYPGQKSAADFVRFYKNPDILFENELPDLYRDPPGRRNPG